MTNLSVTIGVPICGIMVFLNPVTYRDWIFKLGLRRLMIRQVMVYLLIILVPNTQPFFVNNQKP